MYSPFNGLKRLVARLSQILTPARKPKSRPSRGARLGLENLETRELLSATVPGFTLRGGNLYNTSGAQQQLIDTGVQNFTVVKSKVYDLHTNDALEIMNSDGSGSATLGSNVLSLGLGADGNVYYLQNGNVYNSASNTPVDSGVVAMAVARDGLVFDLGSNGNLNALNPATGGWGFYGSGTRSVGRGDDGNVYYLDKSGNVWSAVGTAPVDNNVVAMAVSASGLVFDLGSNGNLNALNPATGSWGFYGSGTRSVGRGDDGNVYYLDKSGNVWSAVGTAPLDSGVVAMAVSASGLVFDLYANNSMYVLNPATGVWRNFGTGVQSVALGNDGNAYYLQNGYVYSSANSSAIINGGVQSFGVRSDGNFYVLHTNNDLTLNSPAGTQIADFGTVQGFAMGTAGGAYFVQNGNLNLNTPTSTTQVASGGDQVASIAVDATGNLFALDSGGQFVTDHPLAMALNGNSTLSLLNLYTTAWTVDSPHTDIIGSVSTGKVNALSVQGLPDGLSASLSGNTVVITGTPTQIGTFTFTVFAADNTGAAATKQFSLTINPAPIPLSSPSWSGYVVQSVLGAVTAVSGSWVVPNASGKLGAASSVWVGIDGYNLGVLNHFAGVGLPSTTVEQIGTAEDVNLGFLDGTTQPSYYAWWEMYPGDPVQISSITVHPGDSMSASVTYSGGWFTLSIIDKTTGQSFTTKQYHPDLQRSSAEWIVEAPLVGGVVAPLPVLDPVNFQNAYATVRGTAGSIDDGAGTVIPLYIGQGQGSTDSVSGLSDNEIFSSFNVTNEHLRAVRR